MFGMRTAPRRGAACMHAGRLRNKMPSPVATTPSAQYSLTLRVEIDHRPGMLGKVASAIGDAGGTIGAVDLVQVEAASTRSVTSPSRPPTRRTGRG